MIIEVLYDQRLEYFDAEVSGLIQAAKEGDELAVRVLRDWLMERGFDRTGGTQPEGRLWVAIEALQAYSGGKWTGTLLVELFRWLNRHWFDMHRMLVVVCRDRDDKHPKTLGATTMKVKENHHVKAFLYTDGYEVVYADP